MGTEIERNHATRCIGRLTRTGAADLRASGCAVYSFGIFETLTDHLRTRTAYYADGCHLNGKGLDLALRSLNHLCARHGLTLMRHFGPPAFLSEQAQLIDIAPAVRMILSSSTEAQSSLTRRPERGYCFHTDLEAHPALTLDIGYAAVLHSLVIFNRFDAAQERARHLVISAGNYPLQLPPVFRADPSWWHGGAPLVITFGANPLPVRFLRLHLEDTQYFHLGEVRIIAQTFQHTLVA